MPALARPTGFHIPENGIFEILHFEKIFFLYSREKLS
jgi:hypothetical protein